MTIALLNIPFAIVGIAIAIVPLLIGMKHQARVQDDQVAVSRIDAVRGAPPVEEFERAA